MPKLNENRKRKVACGVCGMNMSLNSLRRHQKTKHPNPKSPKCPKPQKTPNKSQNPKLTNSNIKDDFRVLKSQNPNKEGYPCSHIQCPCSHIRVVISV